MLALSQFHILATLSESAKTVVYQAWEQSQQRPVILKTLTSRYPATVDVARLKYEYDLIRDLELPGVIIPYAWEDSQSSPILVLEDFGGRDLEHWLTVDLLSIEQVLGLGQQIAEILGQLHQQQIIHKDIKPKNIIFNPTTNQLKLIDFAIASRLSKENPTLSSPNLLEGTLAYISPEQTGRMNRVIDYRTDFYSFGVTLYELLTGQLPFQTDDPMELVHCHIAKTSTPPHLLQSDIPDMVSALVLKLMAKNAEDRYQSAYGIKADLAVCLEQWQQHQAIATFALGQQDQRGRFAIPQKLYGRETEVEQLLQAFERVSQGKTEMLLVAGYSGIGKSALVNEVHKPITRQRGYFISGKFDQFQRHIPYASLIQAFRELVRQLLTETEAQIATWQAKLTTALGKNAQVIIDVIPEIELIIGPQPPVQPLPPAEAQNRFNLVLRGFIRVFTQPEHPLVMFLDDLQWADAASLQLIQLLMTDTDRQYLLLLGAYRDNEVSPAHPLIRTLAEIQSLGAVLNTLTLKPLNLTEITTLISETLQMDRDQVMPLAALLYQKTQGNPFFLTQLFKYLYTELVLTFNLVTGVWQWNCDELHTIEITANVVDLMIKEIQKLPLTTQEILQFAACIGSQFDLQILTVVYQQSLTTTAAALWSALQAGLVVPLSDTYNIPQVLEDCENVQITYKFLHDRVQQAAYSLIPEAERQHVHLQVGRLLHQSIPLEQLEDRIFDVVNPLNMGVTLITDPTERLELAQLNLQAGCKAKAAAAYTSALEYLTAGRELLPAQTWQRYYPLTLQLYTEAVEVEYLLTHFEQAQQLSELALAEAQTLMDKVKIYELKLQFFIAQNQMLEAVETGLWLLEVLGYPLSTDPAELCLVRPLPSLAEVDDYPEMQDPVQLAMLNILALISGPAYQARPDILMPIVYKARNLCLEFGHSPLAAYAYGTVLAPFEIEPAYHAGQISLRIFEKYPVDALKCKVNMLFQCFVRHWKEPHQLTISGLDQTVQIGLETGDFVYAAYAAMFACGYMLLTGLPLVEVAQEQQIYLEILTKIKQDHGLYPAKTWRQLTQNLQGEAPSALTLTGTYLSSVEIEHLKAAPNQMLLFFLYCAEVMLAYVMGDWDKAKAKIVSAAQYQIAAYSSMFEGAYVFYEVLVQLAVYPTLLEEEQTTTWDTIEAKTVQIANWASHAPHNYQSKYELVLAERARVRGDALVAMAHYDTAIAAAQTSGLLAEVALAAERAADFYRAIGREKIAQQYLLDAAYGYERWGAKAKVAALQAEYPLLHRISLQTGAEVSNTLTLTQETRTTTEGPDKVLDVNTVVKAAQALSSEIVLPQLLSRLMGLALENAGAQVGYLLLWEAEQWTIAALGQVDETTAIDVEMAQPLSTQQALPLTLIQYVQRTQEAVVLDHASATGLFTADPYIVANQIQSVLGLPILQQGQLLGLLYLENNLATGVFTDDRLEVLRILAAQAAISLENARFYQTLEAKVARRTTQLAAANTEISQLNQRLKAENLRMGAELDVAQRMQEMILPKPAELAAVPDLDIAGFMTPADEVGGDYYDVLVKNGGVTIGIGDVTGHGLESGLVMLMAQATFRALTELQEVDPARFLNTLNATLYKNVERMGIDRQMTLAVLNYADGQLSIAGQHEEVLVVRANGRLETVDTLDLGMTLALVDDISDFVTQAQIELQPGDGVVLYTDGIPEAKNARGEFYGLERLCQVVQRHWSETAQCIQEQAIADVQGFIGAQKVADDITLVVLKRC